MSRSGPDTSRGYDIGVALALSLCLAGATAQADPLVEPWRIARADPIARLRSAELEVRRGGAYAILSGRLGDLGDGSPIERGAEDDALVTLLAQETDVSARLTALAALALPAGRDLRAITPRVEALRLGELAPATVALAALHAVGAPEALLDAARARGSVVSDDDLGAVALDALATRPLAALAGRPVEEPLRWRILARRRDPSAAAAIVEELGRAVGEIRGGRGLSAIRAARSLRLADAVPALLAVARAGPERELRRQAAEALGDLGGVSDEALVALADDPVTRAPALRTLVRLRARGAFAAVQRCLAMDDPGDRLAALEALATLGDGDSLAVAQAHLERERDPGVRSRAQAMLAGVGAVERGPRESAASTAVLRRILLTSVDEDRRIGAAMALATRDGADALPALEAARGVAWSRRSIEALTLAISAAGAAVEP